MNFEKLPEAIERVVGRSIPEPNSGCWIWLGSTDVSGYGRIYFEGKNWRASRLTAYAKFGDIGELHALHRCDNRLCVNPDHIFTGTNLDNMMDKLRKGRTLISRPPNAALSDDDVQHIRSRPRCLADRKALAAVYGVSLRIIRDCCDRRSYRHVA
jgi:hypothetical protein